MNNMAATLNPTFSGWSSYDTTPRIKAVSDASRKLDNIIKTFNNGSRAVTIETKEGLKENLAALYHEYSSPNWDGYNAAPVEYATYLRTLSFIDVLPTNIHLPSATPEPDGEISLDWECNNKILSVSIGDGEKLHYAAFIDEQNKMDGISIFDGKSIPEVFQFILKQIYS